MTGSGKTGAAFSDVDDTVKHCRENERAGLLHNSRELIVQLCEKSTGIGGLSRVRFDQCRNIAVISAARTPCPITSQIQIPAVPSERRAM